MRSTFLLLLLTLAACDVAGRPAGPPSGPGIYPDASTGAPGTDEPRLDLGDTPPLPDLPAEGTSGAGGETTGEIAETGSSSSSGASAAGGETTSTGEASSSSTGEAGSSTGEPAPVCGDGVCDPAERAPCWSWADGHWGPGFCAEDCMKDPACVAVLDCPCSPEAAAVKSWCYADPPPACSATAPGGACGISDALAFFMWSAKCG